MKWFTGKVHWYDETSGEGVVGGPDGEAFFLHYSCIAPNKVTTAYAKRRSVVAGQVVKFTLYTNLYSSRIARLRIIRKGGTNELQTK